MNIRKQGVVAVVQRNDFFLVIRRSEYVRAPLHICFPGGGIEDGESEQEAICREMHEELDVFVRPIKRIWESVSRSGMQLFWWQTEIVQNAVRPNPEEVESFGWLKLEQILAQKELLATNHEFLSRFQNGEIAFVDE